MSLRRSGSAAPAAGSVPAPRRSDLAAPAAGSVPAPRRSPRLAAKAAAQKPFVSEKGKALEYAFALPQVAPAAPAPAEPACTMAAHEASCAYCREHPEWRQIKDNLNLMLDPFVEDKIKSKAARAAAALAIHSYINEAAVDFVLAHKRLLDTVIDRCRHCIENSYAEHQMLRMVCSDLLRKLKA